MNSKCEVQSKTRCESHEPCVCIAGFPACGCQKKSVFLPRRSSQYHSLVPIPLPRPDTNPSSRYHSLRPHDPVPVTICIATLLTETHGRRRPISGSLYFLRKRYRTAATSLLLLLLLKCCFTSTETVGVLGTGAQDVHLDFHTATEHCCHFGGVHAAGNVSSDSTQRRTPPRLLYAPY